MVYSYLGLERVGEERRNILLWGMIVDQHCETKEKKEEREKNPIDTHPTRPKEPPRSMPRIRLQDRTIRTLVLTQHHPIMNVITSQDLIREADFVWMSTVSYSLARKFEPFREEFCDVRFERQYDERRGFYRTSQACIQSYGRFCVKNCSTTRSEEKERPNGWKKSHRTFHPQQCSHNFRQVTTCKRTFFSSFFRNKQNSINHVR